MRLQTGTVPASRAVHSTCERLSGDAPKLHVLAEVPRARLRARAESRPRLRRCARTIVATRRPTRGATRAGLRALARERRTAQHLAGRTGRILRPSPTLYLLLKCGRMSESDLDDCRAQLAAARAEGRAIDVARVSARLEASNALGSEEARARRDELRAELERSAPRE